MKSISLAWLATIGCVLLSATNATSGGASANTSARAYVLEAPGAWGAAQDAAVRAARGTVLFRHGASGIACVESENPDFARHAKKGGAIVHATLDQVVQWQEPLQGVEEAAVIHGDALPTADETFLNVQWNLLAIEAQGAWDAGYTGAGVRVAVLDGGIASNHLDLDGNLDVAHCASFIPGVAFDEDASIFRHASHVAGIVAAEDNGLGTVGVAPGATLIAVKVLHNEGGSFGQVIAGILYAADPIHEGGAGADIINMSLGGLFSRDDGDTEAAQLIAAMAKAVDYATARNVLVVCAAGNDAIDMDQSDQIHLPSMSGSAVAVSATGPVGYGVEWPEGAMNFRRPARYSNFGISQVWLAAPGGDFTPLPGICVIPQNSADSTKAGCGAFDMVLSPSHVDAGNHYYVFAFGTSMATPVVSGVAALVKQRFPGISVDDLRIHLARTADDEGMVGQDPFYGHGFVNARRAVTMPVSAPTDPPAANDVWLAARPNPAAGETHLHFGLPREGAVSLVIRDVAGRTVRRLASGFQAAGEHRVSWDLRDNANRRVRSGLYFATLETEAGVVTRSVVAME